MLLSALDSMYTIFMYIRFYLWEEVSLIVIFLLIEHVLVK